MQRLVRLRRWPFVDCQSCAKSAAIFPRPILADEPHRLVALTIFSEARYKKKRVYWCRGQFTNYRMFTGRAKMLATTAAK